MSDPYIITGWNDHYMHTRAVRGRNPEELRPFGGIKSRDGQLWMLPKRLSDLELMQEAGIPIEIPEDIRAEFQRADALNKYLQDASDLERQADHPQWQTLMPHQRVGVGYLASRERALLSFVPGLGKSATAIVAADVLKAKRILVVAPLTLLPTWGREIKMWSTNPEQVTVGEKGWKLGPRWTIANPEKLRAKHGKKLMLKQWDLLILDESILYKNRKAKRTEQVAELAGKTPRVWMLSGAPVAAYADDLYGQLNILKPQLFSSYWRFVAQWCQTRLTPWSTEIVGNKRPEALRRYLRDLMLSRTPEDVPGLLPDTLFETVKVTLNKTQEKLVEQIKHELEWVDDEGETNVITAKVTEILRLSQAVSCPRGIGIEDDGAKVETTLALLKEEVAQLPALVWVHYRETGEMLQRRLQEKGYLVGLIHGGVSNSGREDILERFQSGELNVLVMQIQTGKFGLSLTEANSVIFHDRSFSFDDWTQSIARVRRLSSKGKVVPTYVLHGGFSDGLVDVILNRKLKSVYDLSLSDLKTILFGDGK